MPSKLILPSNITLVEQGKMLTPRGEHLYFVVNIAVTLSLMSPHTAGVQRGDLSWSDRLLSLRYVRPLLRMVWETSHALVLASVWLRLLRALLPAATLWVSKLILDAVVGRISHGTGTLESIWNHTVGLALCRDRQSLGCSSGDHLGGHFTSVKWSNSSCTVLSAAFGNGLRGTWPTRRCSALH